MQSKIREAQSQKIPYMAILGGREQENNTVSIRLRDGKQENGISIEEFIEKIENKIKAKALDL